MYYIRAARHNTIIIDSRPHDGLCLHGYVQDAAGVPAVQAGRCSNIATIVTLCETIKVRTMLYYTTIKAAASPETCTNGKQQGQPSPSPQNKRRTSFPLKSCTSNLSNYALENKHTAVTRVLK